MVVIITFYIVLNSLLTSLIPPYFVGNAVDLPIVVTLVSVVFWAWVLRPLGAVLAVPLTLLAKALLIDANPRGTSPSGSADQGSTAYRAHHGDLRGLSLTTSVELTDRIRTTLSAATPYVPACALVFEPFTQAAPWGPRAVESAWPTL